MATRVLMIDDAPQDRFLARRALLSEFPDLVMTEVRDADELAHALQRREFDVIITDYQLRWTTGLEVLERLGAAKIEAPVVMFTHTGSEEIAAAGLRGGLADYIVKSPTHYGRLAHGVRVALQNARIARSEREARVREREALRTAEEALRIKDEFLATLSHELRTPLNAISGWLQIVQMDRSEERLERGLSAIERNTALLVRLVSDLVDVSRIVSGALTLRTQATDLLKVVEAALDSVRPALQAKRLQFEVHAAAPLPPVAGDPDRLQQVVWNLLSNAVKFTPLEGRIEVRARALDGMVELSVEDTGCGIRAEFLPQVFDRFSQQDGGVAREHGGLGLGLAIVRHLTEMHGGTVGVQSSEGSGATFTVRLPVVSASTVPSASTAWEARSQLDGLEVLIVDDDADAREVLATLLVDQGARVVAADSAETAYRSLRRAVPHVLICDIGMPGEDGFAFIGRLRKDPDAALASIPAIALTAYARERDRGDSLHAGFDAHLAKPIRARELVDAVDQLARLLARERTRTSGASP
jgi:signal transduction histidine kinase